MQCLHKALGGSLRTLMGSPSQPKCQSDAGQDISGLRDLAQHLTIPSPSPTDEDRVGDAFRLRGQFLARQDRWSDLSDEVRQADANRHMTPAAMPVADLLCFGARSDVVAAVEHALAEGRPDRNPMLLTGIEALEEMLAGAPDDLVRAIVVAQAHMDIGWAWRGSDATETVPQKNLDVFEAHFDRARDILTEFVNSSGDSPLFVSTFCTLNASGLAKNTRIAQDYEQLIDLNPMCPAPMRAMGTYLSPRWYGSQAELELEARRTAARTLRCWGAAGYTWVMFDAIARDADVCADLDVAFFVEGVWDILDRLTDQHTANTLAAYCALTMAPRKGDGARVAGVRAQIAALSARIVRNHLTELHPMIWAHAASGFDNNLRVSSARRFAARGRQQALCKIAELFSSEIAAGYRIVFTSDGPVTEDCKVM